MTTNQQISRKQIDLAHLKRNIEEEWKSLTLSLPECFIEFCEVTLTFEYVDKILWCDHTNESYWAVLSCGTVYYAVQGGSNFWVCGRNPMMWPFKWKLSACIYTWCYLFVKILGNEIWKFGRNLPLATFGSERVKEECVRWFGGRKE